MFLHMALFLCIININMQIDKNKLDWIQIDLTARCQAMCLECSRNINGKDVSPAIESADTWDMKMEIFQKAVTTDMLSDPEKLKRLTLNGNFGDPCIHPQFLEISKYVVDNAHKDFWYRISTNGAMFDSKYWEKVAEVLKPLKYHQVIFAIDGLEDTHHIYRRNTTYQDVINNATAFINAGGNAIWQFIVFNHNKHQVEEAKQRAKDLGFVKIEFKGGYGQEGGARNYTKAVNNDIVDIGDKTKKNDAVKVSISDRESFKDAKDDIINSMKSKSKSLDELLDTEKISCQWYDTNGMYIEYDGTVWMCCWTGDMHRTLNKTQSREWSHITKLFGKHFNNLKYHSFDDILNHEFFASYLDKTFNSTRNDPNTPRLYTCAKTCIWGKNFL